MHRPETRRVLSNRVCFSSVESEVFQFQYLPVCLSAPQRVCVLARKCAVDFPGLVPRHSWIAGDRPGDGEEERTFSPGMGARGKWLRAPTVGAKAIKGEMLFSRRRDGDERASAEHETKHGGENPFAVVLPHLPLHFRRAHALELVDAAVE